MMDALDPYPGNLKRHEVTSNQRAPYGAPAEEQRAPLLSDEGTPLPSEIVARFNVLTKEECGDRLVAAGIYRNGLEEGFREAWKSVEAKITSGELMVVKTAVIESENGKDFLCSNCDYEYNGWTMPMPGQFCRCGAKIIK